MVRVGGLLEDERAIFKRAPLYLGRHPSKPYGFPWYDTYIADADGDSCRLSDGDLLAPALLNAAPTIAGYRTLTRWRPLLEAALSTLGDGLAALGHEATGTWPVVDDMIGNLYHPLDQEPGGYVSGTILSKVLHRKFPQVIPLYDSKVLYAYCDSSGAPITRVRGRTWVDFMSQLSAAIRADMTQPDAQHVIRELRRLAAPRAPISALRAWDIVTWQAVAHLESSRRG